MRSAWFDIVSGSEKGAKAAAVRAALGALAVPFAAASSGRRWLYEARVFRTRRASIPVISVGNITVGGTGKTPLVEYISLGLAERGRRPAVLMRGYGAGRGLPSDEAGVLRSNMGPGVPVIEDPDRFRGALRALERNAADVAVLDDGFQHIQLARDLDLVTVDATSPFGFGRLFPAGCLRERPKALSRADVIVVTRSDLPPAGEVEGLCEHVRALAPGALVAKAVFPPDRLEAARGDAAPAALPLEELERAGLATFCGIGNPRAFGLTVGRLARARGGEVVLARRFADHHPYAAGELAEIAREAGAKGAAFVVTTQKDAARIPEGAWPGASPPLYVLRARFAFVDGEAALWERVERALERAGDEAPPGRTGRRRRNPRAGPRDERR